MRSRGRESMARGAVLAALWAALLTWVNQGWLERQAELPPAWDQALYLTMSLRYHRGLDKGPAELAERVLREPSAVAPLFPLTTVPFYRVLGESRASAELTLAPYLFLLILGTALLALQAGASPLLTVFLVTTFTGIVNFSREYMMDLPAAALATLALAALWRSEGFHRERTSALAGLLTGLTLLTKVLSGIFFVGPILYGLHRRPQRGLLVFLACVAGTAALWYGFHGREIAHYVVHYGFGEGSLPFRSAGDRLLSLSNGSYYFLTLVHQGAGLLPSAAIAIALLAFLFFRNEPKLPVLPVVWLGSGYALLTLLPNKGGERYLLALLPPVAVLTARAIAAVPAPLVKGSVTGLLVLAGAANYAGLTWPTPLTRWTHHHFGTFPHQQPLPPEAMRGWPIEALLDSLVAIRERTLAPPSLSEVEWFLAETASSTTDEFVVTAYRTFLRREPDRQGLEAYRTRDRAAVVASLLASEEFAARPLEVLVLPDHRVINAATLTYLAESKRLPLHFRRSEAGASAEARLGGEAAGTFRCPDGSSIRILMPSRSEHGGLSYIRRVRTHDRAFGAVILSLGIAGEAQEPPPLEPEALREMVETERAFATMGAEQGVYPSFFRYFGEEGIAFDPQPYRFRERARANPPADPPPPRELKLEWWPVTGDVAESGELGYNTGPTLTTDLTPQNRPARHGYFFSVWKKQPDGTWNVAADMGITTPGPDPGEQDRLRYVRAPQMESKKLATKSASAGRAELLRLEGDLAEVEGGEAYAIHARLHRPGEFPILGRKAIESYLQTRELRRTESEGIDGAVAASGELGYTYGRYGIRLREENGTGDESGYFVHVWKRDGEGEWKLVAEVMNPIR